jgi:hypothetical protein
VVQALLVVAAFFGLIELEAFSIEITSFTGVLILMVNGHLMFTYFRLANDPYKDREHFEAVRWVGLIAGYWSIAFGMKFTGVLLGSSLYTFDSGSA